jgi:pyruvate dehydrogenase E2 component (dihydrolipoamide acetyltransferase)
LPATTTVANHAERRIASPRARRVARELGLDWQTLAGTGSQGRIRERDVRAATSGVDQQAASPALSPRRRTIAQRMLASSQQTAAVTLTTRANATNLVSLRNQFKTQSKATGGGLVPSYTDIVARLVHSALEQHPVMAGQQSGDLAIGFAVDTEAGLLVPVLRNVGSQSLLQLAAHSMELIHKARRGTLSMAEMTGGVFTITNLGGYGIDAFTPIINLPETAILGLGAIRREPVVLDDDRISACDQLTLSLTFDHRLVDGAPAARFLQLVVSAIENPAAWLLG